MAFPMNVPIASATRTAVGRSIKGTLRHTRPEDMAAACLREAVARVPGLTAEEVGDVSLGIAMPEAEQGLNMARQAVFLANFPDSVPAQVVNRFCSSGLQAIALAAQAIATGQYDVAIGGGVESMSMVPMSGNKLSLHPGLVEQRPEAYIGMGHTAERVAQKFGIGAREQNAFAARSHQKAVAAIAAGRFQEEIVPITPRMPGHKGGDVPAFAQDEMPRADTSEEVLAKLRPAFAAKGSVTAGNSSPLSDGAAAVVATSEAKCRALGIEPLGYLKAFQVVGVPPDIMGIGPYPAIEALLKRCGLGVADVGLFEINEAFAAQALYCQRELKIPDDKINVNGGAIALGHPLGCTGAKLSTQLLYEMRRRKVEFGVVSMCIGGGMGAAALYQRPH
jgi:acetyl-CoA acyltransferase